MNDIYELQECFYKYALINCIFENNIPIFIYCYFLLSV